jgi:hypothetical protein
MSHGTDKQLEHAEHAQHHAHDPFDRRVAMTMTMMAAILAGVTLASHRGHTETLKLATEAGSKHTQASDQWNLYQAKHIRSNEYQAYLFMEELLAKGELKQDEESKALRNYWIKQINKYEGNDFWQRFRQAVSKGQQKVERGDKSDLNDLANTAKGLEKEAEKAEHESHALHSHVTWIDLGHLGLELALVLCAVAVLTKQKAFWFSGIAFSLVGAGLAAWGIYGYLALGAAEAAAGGSHH